MEEVFYEKCSHHWLCGNLHFPSAFCYWLLPAFSVKAVDEHHDDHKRRGKRFGGEAERLHPQPCQCSTRGLVSSVLQLLEKRLNLRKRPFHISRMKSTNSIFILSPFRVGTHSKVVEWYCNDTKRYDNYDNWRTLTNSWFSISSRSAIILQLVVEESWYNWSKYWTLFKRSQLPKMHQWMNASFEMEKFAIETRFYFQVFKKAIFTTLRYQINVATKQ